MSTREWSRGGMKRGGEVKIQEIQAWLLVLQCRLAVLTSLGLSFTICKMKRLDYTSGFQTFLTIAPGNKNIL